MQFKSQNCNTFVSVSDTKIVYDLYGIDKYLYALGLSVGPAYRGYGLGKDILKIRYVWFMLKCYVIPHHFKEEKKEREIYMHIIQIKEGFWLVWSLTSKLKRYLSQYEFKHKCSCYTVLKIHYFS